MATKEPILFQNGTLVVPHLGITLRALMGCAIANHKHCPKKVYPVVYKGATVSEVRLGKDF